MAIESGELARYRATACARARQAHDHLIHRLDQARHVAVRAAVLLKGVFVAERVVMFGSLVHPELFHLRSDIDLAAWGMPERDYLRAVGQLQALDPTFAVDLVRMEEAPATLRATIEREGQEL